METWCRPVGAGILRQALLHESGAESNASDGQVRAKRVGGLDDEQLRDDINGTTAIGNVQICVRATSRTRAAASSMMP
jgi:hypothetical protein